MIKWVKTLIIVGILSALYFLVALKYGHFRGGGENGYVHTRAVGTMLVGGMKADKDKIDFFADDMLKDDQFNDYWNLLDKSNELRKTGDYKGAIEFRLKALKFAKGIGQEFQTKLGLAKLYQMDNQYELAIKEYEWCIQYSNRPDVIQQLESEIENIRQLIDA
jgi:tetratricopeptide (TPR) repeat protein